MNFLWLIPALPIAGFVILAFTGRRLPHGAVAGVGVGSVGLSALVTFWTLASFLVRGPEPSPFTLGLWRWLEGAGLSAGFGLYVDALALTMMAVITGIGFLIHLYSVGYMAGDEGFGRFFAYMNLFVAAMLILVMADNLLMLYLGWEGVGLCSYLLIGFWYREPANGYAARKAFVVTRVGDTAFAVGLFLLFQHFHILNIQELMARAQAAWPPGTLLPTAAALLLLGGAVGKSAQLPLQTWLPDAMAGPTPVSALIHAATMVTAGVYLIARTHVLFLLSPIALNATAAVGAATLLMAGTSALFQTDIKRVLAYSTISQIGYMFLALGVGAWGAAMFHFMTHACFKALLFLGAGAVIHALDGEQDMLRMGGLRREMPLTFLTFLAGAAALSALPLISAGFYSKDLIIWETFASARGSWILWAAALAGAFLTALYTARMVLLTFEGPQLSKVHHQPGPSMTVPLMVLALLSVGVGFIQLPTTFGGWHLFSDFLASALPETELNPERHAYEVPFEIISAVVVLLGIGLLWAAFRRTPQRLRESTGALARWSATGWGFDWLYDRLLVRPYKALAQLNRDDIVDGLFDGMAAAGGLAWQLASATQTGRLRNYAAGIALGAVLIIAVVVWI